MSTFANRNDHDQSRSRRAIARICGSFGHELNNIAMLILGQSRAIESLATDEKMGRAAARLEEIACQLRNRLDELAEVSQRAGGRRHRVNLSQFLNEIAVEIADSEPERPPIIIHDENGLDIEVGLDDLSLGLAIEMLLDHIVPLGSPLIFELKKGAASHWGLSGPPGRMATKLSIRIQHPEVASHFVHAADASSPDIIIGFENEALALALLKATARRAQGRLFARLNEDELQLDFIAPLFLDVPSFVAAGPANSVEMPAVPRILLVEDDYHVRQVTTSMFSKLGLDVVAVSDFEEASAAMESDLEFALIVSDFLVPKGRDGEVLEAAHRLRPDTPLLCVSGSERASDLVETIPRSRFMRKPYTLSDIRGALVWAGITKPKD